MEPITINVKVGLNEETISLLKQFLNVPIDRKPLTKVEPVSQQEEQGLSKEPKKTSKKAEAEKAIESKMDEAATEEIIETPARNKESKENATEEPKAIKALTPQEVRKIATAKAQESPKAKEAVKDLIKEVAKVENLKEMDAKFYPEFISKLDLIKA